MAVVVVVAEVAAMVEAQGAGTGQVPAATGGRNRWPTGT